MKSSRHNMMEPHGRREERLMRSLAEAALENAESLLFDSQVLYGNRSFGHDFALAVLAEEECGKATIMWLATLDKTARFTKDRKVWLGGRSYEPFASHPMKQTVQLGPSFLLNLQEPVLKGIQQEQQPGTLNPIAMISSVDKYFEQLIAHPERLLEAVKPLIELGGLEPEKQSGLYVDFSKGKIVKPSGFLGSRCQEVIERVSKEVESTRNRLRKGLPSGLEGIFPMVYSLIEQIELVEFTKKWRAGKLSPSRTQREVRRMKAKLIVSLQELVRKHKLESI